MRVLIKGAGDLASGIAVRLHNCGCSVIMTETEQPTTVRRTVAFSAAVYQADCQAEVEGITGRRVWDETQLSEVLAAGGIAILTDPGAEHMDWYRPDVLVDAIIGKRNLGTSIEDAPLVIGVGPGFTAGEDCHYVIETMRGHTLGRVITEGGAIPNTGVPGAIGGYTTERIIRSVKEGIFVPMAEIGESVEKGRLIAYSGGEPVYAAISGVIRGMLQGGLTVPAGMKCGDIDPRCETSHCYTVSDKARAVGGGVLEAILRAYPFK